MAQDVQLGVYYYEMDDELHQWLLDNVATQPALQDLLDAFDYKTPYVSGKWYAPVEMIDTDDELDFCEGYGLLNRTYWFRKSMQPGGYT